MGMVFRYGGREYAGGTAVDIVRAMARAAGAGPDDPRAFVCGALEALEDRVHLRDLGVGRNLSDEVLALNYLCLLDEYGIGRLEGSDAGVHAPADAER